MDTQDFMTRATLMMGSMQAAQPGTRSTVLTADISEGASLMINLEKKCKSLLMTIIKFSDFAAKYDLTCREPGCPFIYVQTWLPSRYTYVLEAFPIVMNHEALGSNRHTEEMVFHSIFEAAIARYTKSSHKPNPVLRDTRCAEFCYRLSIKVEAVSQHSLKRSNKLALLHDFLILQHMWECYRHEMLANVCGTDQMVGFPMPFEFINVAGSDYDFNEETKNTLYFNVHGKQEKIMQAVIPVIVPGMSTSVTSTLSYMSTEKLGPSLGYLMDLMRTQNKCFSVSSALKVYDQIICRLMVMHRYGVVHCDPNPSCLFFGPGESCNVLYISDFGSAILRPDGNALVPRFHDRFVSYLRSREKRCHFAHDLESAFYVFLYLILGRLPWDSRAVGTQPRDSCTETSMDQPVEAGFTDRAQTTEDKEKFWQAPDIYYRTLRLVDHDFSESLYQSFACDLLECLYSKTRDIVMTHSRISPAIYVKEVAVTGSQVYNIYFGLRRIIATYFRFESQSPALKDVHANSKIELLQKQCTVDKRIAWDLSHWCWSYLDPRPNQAAQIRSKMGRSDATSHKTL